LHIILFVAGYSDAESTSEAAPLMILEYMQYGDLHGFLVDHRCM